MNNKVKKRKHRHRYDTLYYSQIYGLVERCRCRKFRGMPHRHRYKSVEGTLGVLYPNPMVCKCGKVRPLNNKVEG